MLTYVAPGILGWDGEENPVPFFLLLLLVKLQKSGSVPSMPCFLNAAYVQGWEWKEGSAAGCKELKGKSCCCNHRDFGF